MAVKLAIFFAFAVVAMFVPSLMFEVNKSDLEYDFIICNNGWNFILIENLNIKKNHFH